jgi:NADPH:quinone reductase-like Zn-dependent oxidoreductase
MKKLLFILYLFSTLLHAEEEFMRQYQMQWNGSKYELVMHQVPVPVVDAGSILVKIHAVSLNRRDLTMLDSHGDTVATYDGNVPISDGAGEVIAIGDGVTEFNVGDRVAGTFFENWVDGPPRQDTRSTARGGVNDGMLSEYVLASSRSLIKIPQHLNYIEASTLPCAGVTAWNAVFKHGNFKQGDTVLLQGTGGVSIFGLQFVATAGGIPIITSSKDAKLEMTRKLGAKGTINYRTQPDWDKDVMKITNGTGVDNILEVGGNETFTKAIASLREGGHITIIGGLTGRDKVETPEALEQRGINSTRMSVGSKEDFARMNTFIMENKLRPIIDEVYSFDQVELAFERMRSNKHFGKIVITL